MASPTLGGDYFYVPYNARIEDVAGVPLPTRGRSVPDSEISRTLKQLAGNALFFFDTCHAGKAAGISFSGAQDYNKLINEIAGSANAMVLASSTGGELSLERDEWQQGAFTKALLEGLAGAADYTKDGVVTVDELNLYVKERVKELTGGLQHPVDLKPKEARNIRVRHGALRRELRVRKPGNRDSCELRLLAHSCRSRCGCGNRDV